MRIEIEIRNVYGRDLAFPANPAAHNLAKLVGQKTISPAQLQIAQQLGHEIGEVRGDKLGAFLGAK